MTVKTKRKGNMLMILGLCLAVIAIAVSVILFGFRTEPEPEPTPTISVPQEDPIITQPSAKPTAPTTPTQPPVTKVSTATIGSTGDILMHDKVIKSGYNSATGTYSYDSIFSVFSRFVSKMDYAVANLEVTLAGADKGYAGYPQFNSPDAIVDSLKSAGFDMLLTANNHSYDTGYKGFMRTQEIVADRGLAHIGTRQNTEDKNYAVAEINGIKIGMICYTYNTGVDANGNVSLNEHPLNSEATALVNSFSYHDLPGFYEKLAGELAQMRADGAEATMLYIHWGDEYNTTPNSIQKKMAQALCDLGIDVIVGNHAHVIQPVELLTNSQDENRKTLCLYSMGNALSNIRKTASRPVHCEDGLLFSVTFAKYSDGTVIVESAEILPTWVNRYTENGVAKYRILAMDGEDPAKWQEDMDLTDTLLEKCRESYQRTQKIVVEGLKSANAYFAQHQAKTEELLKVAHKT